jgi:hypothetical protein
MQHTKNTPSPLDVLTGVTEVVKKMLGESPSVHLFIGKEAFGRMAERYPEFVMTDEELGELIIVAAGSCELVIFPIQDTRAQVDSLATQADTD